MPKLLNNPLLCAYDMLIKFLEHESLTLSLSISLNMFSTQKNRLIKFFRVPLAHVLVEKKHYFQLCTLINADLC